MILVTIAIVTARTVSENAVHGQLWYGIIFLHTKEGSVMILIAMKSKSIHNSKYTTQKSGGRPNKKDGLTRYGDSHVKDKTS